MSDQVEPFQVFEHAGWSLPLFEYAEVAAGVPTRTGARPARAPGAGRFRIEQLQAGFAGADLTITAAIHGGNVAYVFVEVFAADPGAERYFGPVVREYVRAARDVTVGGVTHPSWDDPIDVRVTLPAGMRLLTDGSAAAFCFSSPSGYTVLDGQLPGMYSPAGDSGSFRAVLTLGADGRVRRVVAERDAGRGTARRMFPRALTPSPNDVFTPLVEVLAHGPGGKGWKVGKALSATLRCGGLRVEAAPVLPGDYLAGLRVQALDGGLTRGYVSLHVAPGAV